MAIHPVGQEQQKFSFFLRCEIRPFIESRGEVLGVDVHTYSDHCLEFIPVCVYDLQILKSLPFFAPELIVIVQMGFPVVENGLSFAIDDGSRVIERNFPMFLLLFNVPEYHIALQPLCLLHCEPELLAF